LHQIAGIKDAAEARMLSECGVEPDKRPSCHSDRSRLPATFATSPTLRPFLRTATKFQVDAAPIGDWPPG
jgi:hypothetical protein